MHSFASPLVNDHQILPGQQNKPFSSSHWLLPNPHHYCLAIALILSSISLTWTWRLTWAKHDNHIEDTKANGRWDDYLCCTFCESPLPSQLLPDWAPSLWAAAAPPGSQSKSHGFLWKKKLQNLETPMEFWIYFGKKEATSNFPGKKEKWHTTSPSRWYNSAILALLKCYVEQSDHQREWWKRKMEGDLENDEKGECISQKH